MHLEQARFNMIEQQIRTWYVLDTTVLDRLKRVRREDYVPEQSRALAFVDMEIPLGGGQVMLAPKMEARIVQDLNLKATDKVLEIGTGSGYLTALLASFVQHVDSVEIDPALKALAAANLARNGVSNVTLSVGDGAHGWNKGALYDVIVITGSLPVLPDAFKKQLNQGGRLFVILGEAPAMSATLLTRVGSDTFTERRLFETCTPALLHAQQPERFTF